MMSVRALVASAVLLALTLLSGAGFAGIPCPDTSTIIASGDGYCAPGAAVCPGGDLDRVIVTVTVRDCYAMPMEGMMVTLECEVSGGDLCFCQGEENKTVGPTDEFGVTYGEFAGLGGCGLLRFRAWVADVPLGWSDTIAIVSPDTYVDCEVNLFDFARFAQVFGGYDQCNDYNCDGTVDLVDFGTFALHFLDTCD
jgi:hypothetical protein